MARTTEKLPPVKPRGLEAIAIERTKLIDLLKKERERQAKRASAAKRRHQQECVRILNRALQAVGEGLTPIGKHGEFRVDLPAPPVFRPCDYDQTIHRLTHDDRDHVTLHANEWNRYFPCDVDQNGDGS